MSVSSCNLTRSIRGRLDWAIDSISVSFMGFSRREYMIVFRLQMG
ncbi:hypothetical protein [Methanocalculus sp.]|nr:hypothetical protein [Methanocalculus sp.]MDO8841656.1 hypothetical protein [Methanocalculus sp.]